MVIWTQTHEYNKLNCQYGSARAGRAIAGLMRVGNHRTWCIKQHTWFPTDDDLRRLTTEHIVNLVVAEVLQRDLIRRTEENATLVQDGFQQDAFKVIAENITVQQILQRDLKRRRKETLNFAQILDRDLVRDETEDLAVTESNALRDLKRRRTEDLVTSIILIRDLVRRNTEDLSLSEVLLKDMTKLSTEEWAVFQEDLLRDLTRLKTEDLGLSVFLHPRDLTRLNTEDLELAQVLLRDLTRRITVDLSFIEQLDRVLNRSTDAEDLTATESDALRDLWRTLSLTWSLLDGDRLGIVTERTASIDHNEIIQRDLKRRTAKENLVASEEDVLRDLVRRAMEQLDADDVLQRDLTRRTEETIDVVGALQRDIILRSPKIIIAPGEENAKRVLTRRTKEDLFVIDEMVERVLWRRTIEDIYLNDQDRRDELRLRTEDLFEQDITTRDLKRRRLEVLGVDDVLQRDLVSRYAEDLLQSDITTRALWRTRPEEAFYIAALRRTAWRTRIAFIDPDDGDRRDAVRILAERLFETSSVTDTAFFRLPATLTLNPVEEVIDRELTRTIKDTLLPEDSVMRDLTRTETETIYYLLDRVFRHIYRLTDEMLDEEDATRRDLTRRLKVRLEQDHTCRAVVSQINLEKVLCAVDMLPFFQAEWEQHDVHGSLVREVLEHLKIQRDLQ